VPEGRERTAEAQALVYAPAVEMESPGDGALAPEPAARPLDPAYLREEVTGHGGRSEAGERATDGPERRERRERVPLQGDLRPARNTDQGSSARSATSAPRRAKSRRANVALVP